MSRNAWVAFAAVSLLWGIPYLFIKVAVEDGMSPGFLSWGRVVLGSAILLAICARAGLFGQLRGRLGAIAVYAIGEIAIPFPLIAAGEQYVSSSLAAILIATVPLMVASLALRFDPSERVGGAQLAGLLVGFAGVVALVGIDVAGDPDELRGAGLILLASLGYAAAPMYLRARLSDLDPRAIMAAALTIAAIALTPLALAQPPTAATGADAWSSLVVLGVFCTAAAFVIFGRLVIEIGAGRALVITYVAPVVALVAGLLVLGERVGPGAVLGLGLIIVGSWLATSRRKGREPAPPGPSGTAAEMDAGVPGR